MNFEYSRRLKDFDSSTLLSIQYLSSEKRNYAQSHVSSRDLCYDDQRSRAIFDMSRVICSLVDCDTCVICLEFVKSLIKIKCKSSDSAELVEFSRINYTALHT